MEIQINGQKAVAIAFFILGYQAAAMVTKKQQAKYVEFDDKKNYVIDQMAHTIGEYAPAEEIRRIADIVETFNMDVREGF